MAGFQGRQLDELCEFCQDYYDYAAPSLAKSKTAFADPIDYEAQAGQAESWLRRRAQTVFNRLENQQLIVGDVNGDGRVTIADITELIDYLLGGLYNTYIERAGDVNGDGEISIADVTDLIDKLLSSS